MRKRTIFNLLFMLVAFGIIVILLNAPKPTTPFLPKDGEHKKFYSMKKKNAEKHCEKCHVKLSEKHPPKYRCLLCHKKDI